MHLAMVGYGKIAAKHLEVLRALGARVDACCNRSAEGRRRAESEGGFSRTYATIDEMVDRERPDGIVCCASLDGIYDAARLILPHRIPTLLEKPPGTSWDEYSTMREVQRRFQTPVVVGLNRRHYSVLQRALADAGGPGAITAVFVEWSEDPRHLMNRGITPDLVARMVFGNSLHGLDLMTFLAGDVPNPEVVVRDLGAPFRWMMGLIGVSSRGALVSFSSTWDSPGRWRVSFCVPGRRYVFTPLEACEVLESGNNRSRPIEPDEIDIRFKAGFHSQATAFLEMIRTGKAPVEFDLDSVEPAMKLADKLTTASNRGNR
jgi:predicted dehydrogenase